MPKMKKLAIVSSHPIQYNAPWFKLLSDRNSLDLKVFYTWSQASETVKDITFGHDIKWDIPLLEGYAYEFIDNVASKPGSHHFFGIDCPELISKLEQFRPDAILFFGWNFKSHLKAMRYFKGKIPVWFRGDSTLLDESVGIKTALRCLLLTQVYSYVDKAFYVGMASKKYFLKHGLKENQLVYAPHAIDNLRFNDSILNKYETRALEWRTELGFQPEDIVVLFAGKFENKKQPDFLVKAVIEANKKRTSPLKLLLVGAGPLESELKQYADCHNFINIIPFQNQTQMPLVYRLGNVFCLPSKGPGETWGLAVNEAMACSRSVIVSNKVGCAADLVTENLNGWVFEYDNMNELIKLLKTLQIDNLNSQGQSAAKFVKDWNFSAIVDAIEFSIIKIENPHN